MKILVTGAQGFIGKNLTFRLLEKGFEVLLFDSLTNDVNDLPELILKSDFIVHLAGINRPSDIKEFDDNYESTKTIVELVQKSHRQIPILYSSSVQATSDNPYGKSKKRAEDALFDFQKESGNKTFIYRLHNVFGKWSRPNYNSVVATFCHNIARDLPIVINDPKTEISFVYIDDVVNSFLFAIQNSSKIKTDEVLFVEPIYKISLGKIVDLLEAFKKMRVDLHVPSFKDEFERKLYATYLSYLPSDKFTYPIPSHRDERGSFTEIVRTESNGQFSINIIKPGITKGNHYHHTKNERFVVVSGECETCFRRIDDNEVIVYRTSGHRIEVIDIPTGYTHSIKNIGRNDAVVFMWANEPFDPSNPDTYFMEVEKNG